MNKITDEITVTPSALTPWQYMVLNGYLHDHGVEQVTPTSVPDKLTYACLNCGSIGVAPDQVSRDRSVEYFDMQCCGLTVVFHTETIITPISLINMLSMN